VITARGHKRGRHQRFSGRINFKGRFGFGVSFLLGSVLATAVLWLAVLVMEVHVFVIVADEVTMIKPISG